MKILIKCYVETPTWEGLKDEIIMELDEFFDVDILPPHIEEQIEEKVKTWFNDNYIYSYAVSSSITGWIPQHTMPTPEEATDEEIYTGDVTDYTHPNWMSASKYCSGNR